MSNLKIFSINYIIPMFGFDSEILIVAENKEDAIRIFALLYEKEQIISIVETIEDYLAVIEEENYEEIYEEFYTEEKIRKLIQEVSNEKI